MRRDGVRDRRAATKDLHQKVSEHGERQVRLALVCANHERERVDSTRSGGQLGDKTRFPRTGFADQRNEPTRGSFGQQGRLEHRQLRVTPDEVIGHLGRRRRRNSRPDGEGRGSGQAGKAARADVVVQRGGLTQRRYSELVRQRPHALAVLTKCRGPLARHREHPDGRLLGGLVKRVESDPAACEFECLFEFAARSPSSYQPFEGGAKTLPQVVGGRVLPVVEVRTVAHGEPGQEVAAVQRTCFAEGFDIARLS